MPFSKNMCQGLWNVLFQEVLPHGQGFSLCQVVLFQGTPDLTNNGKVVGGHMLSHLNNEMQFATLHPTLKVRSWLWLVSICLLEINPRSPFFGFISQGLAWLALALTKACLGLGFSKAWLHATCYLLPSGTSPGRKMQFQGPPPCQLFQASLPLLGFAFPSLALADTGAFPSTCAFVFEVMLFQAHLWLLCS